MTMTMKTRITIHHSQFWMSVKVFSSFFLRKLKKKRKEWTNLSTGKGTFGYTQTGKSEKSRVHVRCAWHLICEKLVLNFSHSMLKVNCDHCKLDYHLMHNLRLKRSKDIKLWNEPDNGDRSRESSTTGNRTCKPNVN